MTQLERQALLILHASLILVVVTDGGRRGTSGYYNGNGKDLDPDYTITVAVCKMFEELP